MKFFAKLGLNSKVISRIHIHDSDAPTEEAGIEFLNKQTNYPFWKEYKKDKSIRKNSATIGMKYDEDRDAFIIKQPYPSWILDESTCVYASPVAHPDDGKDYKWNEETTNWDEIVS